MESMDNQSWKLVITWGKTYMVDALYHDWVFLIIASTSTRYVLIVIFYGSRLVHSTREKIYRHQRASVIIGSKGHVLPQLGPCYDGCLCLPVHVDVTCIFDYTVLLFVDVWSAVVVKGQTTFFKHTKWSSTGILQPRMRRTVHLIHRSLYVEHGSVGDLSMPQPLTYRPGT